MSTPTNPADLTPACTAPDAAVLPSRCRPTMLSGYIDGDVDLLNLDTKGLEMVVRDLAEQGKLRWVRNILCEYHHHHHRDSDGDRLSLTLVDPRSGRIRLSTGLALWG